MCTVGLTEPQSAFGDELLKFQVVCPQNGTAVLKGLIRSPVLIVLIVVTYTTSAVVVVVHTAVD